MNYQVVVTREGAHWLADVVDVPGAHTYARSIAGLDRSVREVIKLMDDSRDPSFEICIDYSYEGFGLTVDAAALAARERRELSSQNLELRERTRQLASELVAEGYSVRDTAMMLAITSGRVSQLINS